MKPPNRNTGLILLGNKNVLLCHKNAPHPPLNHTQAPLSACVYVCVTDGPTGLILDK